MKKRAQVVFKLYGLLEENREELAQTIHLENGKTLTESYAAVDKAMELQFSILEYRNSFCLGNFPAVVKQSLFMIGIDAGLPLPPVQSLSDKALSEVKEILSKLI